MIEPGFSTRMAGPAACMHSRPRPAYAEECLDTGPSTPGLTGTQHTAHRRTFSLNMGLAIAPRLRTSSSSSWDSPACSASASASASDAIIVPTAGHCFSS